MNQVSMAFSGHPESVALARHWLDDLLSPTSRTTVPEDTRHIAVLLLSELATNAIRHTHSADDGEYTVSAFADSATLRVEVADSGPRDGRPATLRVAAPNEEAGRGLTWSLRSRTPGGPAHTAPACTSNCPGVPARRPRCRAAAPAPP